MGSGVVDSTTYVLYIFSNIDGDNRPPYPPPPSPLKCQNMSFFYTCEFFLHYTTYVQKNITTISGPPCKKKSILFCFILILFCFICFLGRRRGASSLNPARSNPGSCYLCMYIIRTRGSILEAWKPALVHCK